MINLMLNIFQLAYLSNQMQDFIIVDFILFCIYFCIYIYTFLLLPYDMTL